MEGTRASEAQKAVAATEGVSGSAELRRRRPTRPRVVFHVTGFGVFNGIADNPTTHLVNDLPGELRARRRVRRHGERHGQDRPRGGGVGTGGGLSPGDGAALPVFVGVGDRAFEVRSCSVLDVSAKVGGRQLRELHASSSVSPSSGGEKTALAADESSAPGAGVGGGGVGDSPGSRGRGGGVGVACARDKRSGASGGSNVADKKGAYEGRGPGGSPAQNDDATEVRAGGGGGTSGAKDIGKRDVHDTEEEDAVTTVFVHCGVDGSAKRFKLETHGFNEATFRVPDEKGYCPSFTPVEKDNPDTGHCRVTTIPVVNVLERLEAMGWGPEYVAESKDAGRFVCNYVYYMSLGLCEQPASAVSPAASVAETEGGVQTGAPSEKCSHVFCFSGNGNTDGDGVGSGGGSDGRRTAGATNRHSLFIHVPPFKALSKDKQLVLLVACLSAIAAALSPSSLSPSPSPSSSLRVQPTDAGPGTDIGNSFFAAATAAAAATTPAPPLSLSSYEAVIVADEPETSSSGPSEVSATEENSNRTIRADALPLDRSDPGAPMIWDRTKPAESPRQVAVDGDAGGASGGASGGGGSGRQRLVQFALDPLASDDEENGRTDDGGNEGSERDASYAGGEIGVARDGEGDESQERGEAPAEATRRKLIETGYDGLDVDAAMATTGSDSMDVNMDFLLDITPLLPPGAPSEADGLFSREHGNNGDGGGGGVGGGKGVIAIRPGVMPMASPSAMGGVSPKWMKDVSPAGFGADRGRGATKATGSGSGSGGFFSRLRRGHKRAPSAPSAASEAITGGEGGHSSELTTPSASRQRSSSITSAPVHRGEYTRRTTAHVIRSHSPPPVRGVGGRNGGGDFRGGVGAIEGQPRRRGLDSSASAAPVSAGWGETLPSGHNLRLVLLVRLDLGMTPGTIAAQCSRAALAAARKAETRGRADTLAVWREAGESIVVLGAADSESLDAVLEVGAASHLPITMVRDKQAAWMGHVRADNCTVAAVGPAPMSALRAVAGSLPVL
ncbi:unnamed protein product [Pylaiella littoralis]